MAPIIDEFLRPVEKSSSNIEFQADVVSWQLSAEGDIVVQIFRRSSGSFGIGYLAWVAWRDAGDCVQSHSWHPIAPSTTAILASETEAKSYAEHQASTDGIKLKGQWCSVI